MKGYQLITATILSMLTLSSFASQSISLTPRDISCVSETINPPSSQQLTIDLTAAGQQKLASLAYDHIGDNLVISDEQGIIILSVFAKNEPISKQKDSIKLAQSTLKSSLKNTTALSLPLHKNQPASLGYPPCDSGLS